MRELTNTEIKKFATKRGVRGNAVENFLESLGSAGSKSKEIANLHDDAREYGWNAATVKAIKEGIELAYKV